MARQPGLNVTRADWADFARWCVARGENAIPAAPESVVDYIEELAASNEAASVSRRVGVIRDWHRASGLTAPTGDERVRIALTRAQWRQRRGPAPTKPPPATGVATILPPAPRRPGGG